MYIYLDILDCDFILLFKSASIALVKKENLLSSNCWS